MTERNERRKAYPRPAPALAVHPDQMPLLDERCGAPDPATEAKRQNDVRSRLHYLKAEARRIIVSVEQTELLLERGIQLPDVAEGIGLPPPVDRASKPLKPWRLRPGTIMDLIATMLEDAGRKGVSEPEMLERLAGMGHLSTARSVHWTVSELRKRTRFIFRSTREKGARWYAYGRLDVWRRSAHKSDARKTRSPP